MFRKSEIRIRIQNITRDVKDSFSLTGDHKTLQITMSFSLYKDDEIKGTYRKLDFIKEPKREHIAQAMCYAYMVLTKEKLSEVGVQVTYCNFETEAIRRFKNTLTKEEITAWFLELMQESLSDLSKGNTENG